MFPKIILCVLFLYGNYLIASASESDTYISTLPNNTRIVGGFPARLEDFPYQVSLQNCVGTRCMHFCGGSLISQWTVLTAAHCVYDIKTENLKILAGSSTIAGVILVRHVSKITIHKSYNPRTIENDIAVVKLKDKIPFNRYVDSIGLQTGTVKDNTSCVVSGWGKTSANSDVSPDLRYVNIPIVNRNLCSKVWGPSLTLGTICAGIAGKDSCQGDSGGPLVCHGLVTGIVSWGDSNCGSRNPGVYTEVAAYRDWIRKNKATSLTSVSFVMLIGFTLSTVFLSK